MNRRRAGRKRKLAMREPSGRIARSGESAASKADKGTPELQAKRQALAAGGDPAATTRWLDLLTAWGLLTPRQQQAGADYARLRAWLFGAPGGRLKAGNLDPEQAHGKGTRRPEQSAPGGHLSEAALLAAERRYERATRRLRAVSRQMEAEVRALVLDNRPPLIALAARVETAGVPLPNAQTVIPAPEPGPMVRLGTDRGGSAAAAATPRRNRLVPCRPRNEPRLKAGVTAGGEPHPRMTAGGEPAAPEARPRKTVAAGSGVRGPQGLPSPTALKQWAWLSVGLEVLDAALAEDTPRAEGGRVAEGPRAPAGGGPTPK